MAPEISRGVRPATALLTTILLLASSAGSAGVSAETPASNRAAARKVVSKDGTSIAYERSGKGPVVILVASALADRSAAAQLAALLAENFTVINYDRRGRGESGDTSPYAVAREVEDIAALIEEAGGPVYIFGHSSGAVLALEAVSKLSSRIKKAVLYEPPFIVDDSRAPIPEDFTRRVNELVSAGRRGDAVEHFMVSAVNVPPELVKQMRTYPMWPGLEKLAHTIAYDIAVMGDTQAGKPLPAKRWASASSFTIVMCGDKSPPFLQRSAKAVADILPNAKHQTLKGQDHSVVFTAPKVIAAALNEIFSS
jgi:pimeloyl-ACP methyl ester carboxylesterase